MNRGGAQTSSTGSSAGCAAAAAGCWRRRADHRRSRRRRQRWGSEADPRDQRRGRGRSASATRCQRRGAGRPGRPIDCVTGPRRPRSLSGSDDHDAVLLASASSACNQAAASSTDSADSSASSAARSPNRTSGRLAPGRPRAHRATLRCDSGAPSIAVGGAPPDTVRNPRRTCARPPPNAAPGTTGRRTRLLP